MNDQSLRLEMARKIVDFEARRDKKGHLKVYELPEEDGGGEFEVAGICNKYHPDEAETLRDLIENGFPQKAEVEATKIIADYTEEAARWTTRKAIEFFLRDCIFNRGLHGATMILQHAVGVDADGIFGSITRKAVADDEIDVDTMLLALYRAREWYERKIVKRDEQSQFWKGLVNRWNNCLKEAEGYKV